MIFTDRRMQQIHHQLQSLLFIRPGLIFKISSYPFIIFQSRNQISFSIFAIPHDNRLQSSSLPHGLIIADGIERVYLHHDFVLMLHAEFIEDTADDVEIAWDFIFSVFFIYLLGREKGVIN